MKKFCCVLLGMLTGVFCLTACAGPAADRYGLEQLMDLKGRAYEEVVSALGLQKNEYELEQNNGTAERVTVRYQDSDGVAKVLKLVFGNGMGEEGLQQFSINCTKLTHEQVFEIYKANALQYDQQYGEAQPIYSGDNDTRRRISSFASFDEWQAWDGYVFTEVWFPSNGWAVRQDFEFLDDHYGTVLITCESMGSMTQEEYCNAWRRNT